jgi:hypothetical protein
VRERERESRVENEVRDMNEKERGIESNQIKSNQIESNRIESHRIASNRIESNRIVHFISSTQNEHTTQHFFFEKRNEYTYVPGQ